MYPSDRLFWEKKNSDKGDRNFHLKFTVSLGEDPVPIILILVNSKAVQTLKIACLLHEGRQAVTYMRVPG